MKQLPKILSQKEVEELSLQMFPTFGVPQIEADRVCMRKGFIRGYMLAQQKFAELIEKHE